MKVILAEAAIELVPPEIARHPAIKKSAARRNKKPTNMLLDISLHYHAMRKLREKEKRGRPDILHVSLLELLSSPLNIEGKLRTYVHTYGDYGIIIDPSTRIPRNYNRFVGLIEQLLSEGKVPPDSDKPLMTAFPATFETLLKTINAKATIILSEDGKLESPENICKHSLERDLPIVIGAFPHGNFSQEVIATAEEIYSIYHKPLDAWVVASRIIYACEKLLGILI